MNNNQIISPNINKSIIEKLKIYPREISELAIEAIILSENLPEDAVYEFLQGKLREIARNIEGDL